MNSHKSNAVTDDSFLILNVITNTLITISIKPSTFQIYLISIKFILIQPFRINCQEAKLQILSFSMGYNFKLIFKQGNSPLSNELLLKVTKNEEENLKSRQRP